jgi:hypothetical protein
MNVIFMDHVLGLETLYEPQNVKAAALRCTNNLKSKLTHAHDHPELEMVHFCLKISSLVLFVFLNSKPANYFLFFFLL